MEAHCSSTEKSSFHSFLPSEFSGLCDALQCSAPARGTCELCIKFFLRQTWMMLLQKQVGELFASRDNRPPGHRRLLDCVHLVGCRPHQGYSLIRCPVCSG
jgi:hypothetical protein